MKLGSHVGMSGKEMLLGSAKEAVSYGADTFMFYTGAPQNTRRKSISELNIDAAWDYLSQHQIEEIIVHAPYIINLGNSVKPETFELAVQFLQLEIERTAACKSQTLILHPGAHVGAGTEAGIAQIIKGLNEVLTADTPCNIALETMAGKGSEIGRSFEELAQIYDGVIHSDKLRVCFDTCHTSDSGYDIIHDFDGVIEKFDRLIGKDQIAVSTVRILPEPPKTGMPISDLEKLDLMHSPISYITRILQMSRKSLRPLIFLLRQKRRNPTHHINTRWRCFAARPFIQTLRTRLSLQMNNPFLHSLDFSSISL